MEDISKYLDERRQIINSLNSKATQRTIESLVEMQQDRDWLFLIGVEGSAAHC